MRLTHALLYRFVSPLVRCSYPEQSVRVSRSLDLSGIEQRTRKLFSPFCPPTGTFPVDSFCTRIRATCLSPSCRPSGSFAQRLPAFRCPSLRFSRTIAVLAVASCVCGLMVGGSRGDGQRLTHPRPPADIALNSSPGGLSVLLLPADSPTKRPGGCVLDCHSELVRDGRPASKDRPSVLPLRFPIAMTSFHHSSRDCLFGDNHTMHASRSAGAVRRVLCRESRPVLWRTCACPREDLTSRACGSRRRYCAHEVAVQGIYFDLRALYAERRLQLPLPGHHARHRARARRRASRAGGRDSVRAQRRLQLAVRESPPGKSCAVWRTGPVLTVPAARVRYRLIRATPHQAAGGVF